MSSTFDTSNCELLNTIVIAVCERLINYLLITYSMINIQKAVVAWAKMCETDLDRVTIRRVAITNCPFRFAFSHLPGCGQLLRQKDRKKTLYEICVQDFLRFSDSNKPSQPVSLIYESV